MTRASPGYTLLEAAIAMLLTAVMASSVFTVALSAKRSSGRGMRKLIADQAARQLSERLKNYVMSDPALVVPSLPPANIAGIIGPSGATYGWRMRTDDVPGVPGIQDNCAAPPFVSESTCYALAGGSHTLKNYLPPWFEAAPFMASIGYWVNPTAPITVAGGRVEGVSISVMWNEL